MAWSDAQLRPVDIALDRERSLTIKWADGHTTELPLVRLRQACPCAVCRTSREEAGRKQGGLPVQPSAAQAAEMVTAEGAELVGTYAVRILWRDGHRTGIYDFALLRRLDRKAPTSP